MMTFYDIGYAEMLRLAARISKNEAIGDAMRSAAHVVGRGTLTSLERELVDGLWQVAAEMVWKDMQSENKEGLLTLAQPED